MRKVAICLAVLAACMAGSAPGQNNADAAQKALDAVAAKLNKLESLSLEMQAKTGQTVHKYPMLFSKPNLYRAEIDGVLYVCDGAMRHQYFAKSKEFLDIKASNLKGVGVLPGFETYTNPAKYGIKAVSLTTAKLNGKVTKVIKMRSDKLGMDLTLTVNAATGYPLKLTTLKENQKRVITFAKFIPNAKINKSKFVWKVPAGATAYKQPESKLPDYTANLLKISSQAPDFELMTTSGTAQKLSSYFGKGKAVLVNFWFYG